ncbi:MAG: GNAT family N-acetyltransferase [Candidatus Thiodiazotropha sp. (ex Semelilucina semeliformis)]|nr:GNAT family N-acetyltransferase [Candidatus Thiodiazotropha sp. (ex Semelilucina semeliformis)]
MEPIVYQEMAAGEETAVCNLVADVFNEYVAPDYDQEGIDEFFRFADPDAMKERMLGGGFVLVAKRTGKLVGMLEFFPPDCVAMLFVTVHHQGIAKGLLARAIRKAQVRNPGLSKLIVHSSPYAESIYEKMGFRKTGGIQHENGIDFFPMELICKTLNTN